MLFENYDLFYGIKDHGLYNKDNPFSLVEMHDSERFDLVNPLYEIYEKFTDKDVYKYTGIPLDRFLDLPRDRVNKIFELCSKLKDEDSKRNSSLQTELEKFNQLGKK